MWDYVDSALCSDKRNGRRSTRHVVMVGNTPVFSKATLQMSVEKSTYRSEFVACGQAKDAVMTVRDQIIFCGHTFDEPSKL